MAAQRPAGEDFTAAAFFRASSIGACAAAGGKRNGANRQWGRGNVSRPGRRKPISLIAVWKGTSGRQMDRVPAFESNRRSDAT